MISKINLTPTRNHKIKSDYGMLDYFKYYKENGGKLDIKQYRKILKEFNSGLYDIICTNDYVYTLPKRMGFISIYKIKNYVKVEDGELKTNLPPNWNETLKLWAVDEEAREHKTLIRVENSNTDRYTHRIMYTKSRAVFKNKTIYKMQINRALKQHLKDKINKGNFDSSIYRYGL